MLERALVLSLASLVPLTSLSSAQAGPRPPQFAELRKHLPDLPWVKDTELGDWDGDGDLDALISTRPPTWLQEELTLYVNDGHATFRRWDPVVGASSVNDIAGGDLDGDGDEDALLAASGALYVLRNDGASTLGYRVAQNANLALNSSDIVWRVTSADIDSDRIEDALLRVTRSGVPSFLLARGTGGGTFAPLTTVLVTGAQLGELAVADVDGDGNQDLVYSDGTWLRLRFGNGAGGFPAGVDFVNSSGRFVATGDVDGDGDTDLVAGDPPHVFLNLGARLLLRFVSPITLVEAPSGLELLDVDRDGDLDLALGSSLRTNDGHGLFSSSGLAYPAASLPTGVGESPETLQVGDLDLDGDPDFVLGGTNRVLLGDGAGNYADTASSARVPEAPQELADLDGDGDLDALTVVATYPAIVWSRLSNDGRGEFARTDGVVTGDPVKGPAVFGDLDGDGDRDALVRYSNRVLTNDGTGLFTVLPVGCVPATGFSLDVALGDVDGDGDLDAFHGRGQAGPPSYEGATYLPWVAALWRNAGNGCFSDDSAQLAGTTDLGYGVAIGDVDLDGDGDLTTSYGTLFRNQGGGAFLDAGLGLARSNRDVALGDLDGDGALDLCFGGEIAWNDGAGKFPVLTPLSYYAQRVALGDLNGDGRLDVVAGLFVPSYLRGPTVSFVEVQVNQGARALLPAPFPYTERREFALGDVDGDGDLDVFDGRRTFSNLELSLAHRAAPRVGHPLVLELRGQPAAPFRLFAATSLRSPILTRFGAFHLDATRIVKHRTGVLDGTGSAELAFPIRRDVALIGSTLFWQGLVGLRRPVLTAFERTTLSGF